MKAFKAFGPDWTCQGFKYEVGQEYVHEGKVSICHSGFHACRLPLDCLKYYPLIGGTKFAEVELFDPVKDKDHQNKAVAPRIRIVAELNIAGFIRAHVDALFNLTKASKKTAATTGVRAHAATTGVRAHAATTGDWAHAATKGKNAIAASLGYRATAQASLGAWIVCACYDRDGNALSVQSARVDGDAIKADTPYRLARDGDGFKFEEAEPS